MAMRNAKKYDASQLETADELVQKHGAMVHRIAYHLSARLPASVMVDDLIQAGMLGLLDASQLYDPTQGASFETYATIRIRGSMLDELRRNDWAPKSVHRKERELMAAIRKIEGATGRDARGQEIAEELDISLDEYHAILQETSNCRVLNFVDMGVTEDLMGEGMQSRQPEPSQTVQRDEFKKQLVEAISSLPERECFVVSMYYDDELNLKEIGKVLGVSESRVSQLLSQAHLRIRTKFADIER
ncbi:MAG: RNA polymerase sigma factor FliA [Gammaproteobacteria bacterium]|nr:RNA polymerase sigma factor FliA [Gammaproteobacteria bacterium]